MWQPQTYTPLRWSGAPRPQRSLVNPNDGQPLGTVEQMNPQDVALVAERALRGQQLQQSTLPRVRSEWLRAIVGHIRRDREVLANLIATEGGKPLKDARVEADRAAQTFELCAQEAVNLKSETLPLQQTAAADHKLVFTLREPIGPVLALSAFNHPLNLLAHQVGTALAAGCAVVFKPSPGTPYCGEWLADALKDVGVPFEVAQLCHAEVPEISALLKRSEFQYVSFIGAATIGWRIRAELPPGTRLGLEHGGQAPAIVWDDADLERAVTTLLKGAFYHAGQVCISTQKIFLHEKIAAEFTTRFVQAAKALIVGDARRENCDLGPLIRPSEKQRLQTWFAEATAAGAQALLADVQDRGPQYLGPHIFSQVPHHARLWKEEAFGPVVCLETFNDAQSIYRELADNPFHFEAAVFTRDLARALEAIKLMPAMTVVVNDHTAWRVDAMPFGGHRQSGLGMGGVQWAVEEQTRLKQVVVHGF